VSGDDVRLSFKPSALLAQHVLKVSERFKTTVGKWFVCQIPDPFHGLQFWRIGRECHGFNASGMSLLWRDMEARTIFNEQNMMIRASTKTGRKRGHDELVGLFRDFWDEPELTGSRFRTDEGVKVEPLVARLNRSDGRLTGGGPDGPSDGLQTDAVFIHRPE